MAPMSEAFDPFLNENPPPAAWVDAIRAHYDALDILEVRQRRSPRGGFQPLPDGEHERGELVQALGLTDERQRGAVALGLASSLWESCYLWACEQGPRVDFQLLLYANGKCIFRSAKGARINVGGAAVEVSYQDEPTAELVSVNAHYSDQIKFLVGQVGKLAEACTEQAAQVPAMMSELGGLIRENQGPKVLAFLAEQETRAAEAYAEAEGARARAMAERVVGFVESNPQILMAVMQAWQRATEGATQGAAGTK